MGWVDVILSTEARDAVSEHRDDFFCLLGILHTVERHESHDLRMTGRTEMSVMSRVEVDCCIARSGGCTKYRKIETAATHSLDHSFSHRDQGLKA